MDETAAQISRSRSLCLLERLEFRLQVRDLMTELGDLLTLVDEFGGELS